MTETEKPADKDSGRGFLPPIDQSREEIAQEGTVNERQNQEKVKLNPGDATQVAQDEEGVELQLEKPTKEDGLSYLDKSTHEKPTPTAEKPA